MQANKSITLNLLFALVFTLSIHSIKAEETASDHTYTAQDQMQLESLQKALSKLFNEDEAELKAISQTVMDDELKMIKAHNQLFTLGEYTLALLFVYVYFTKINPWLKANYKSEAIPELGKIIALAPFATVLKNTSEYYYAQAKKSVAKVII